MDTSVKFTSIGDNEFISERLIKGIMQNTVLNLNEATNAVKYNIITPLQLSMITNRSISAIQNLMRPRFSPDGIDVVFTKAFPFRLLDEPGPMFVLFDKNCYDYILSTFKKVTR